MWVEMRLRGWGGGDFGDFVNIFTKITMNRCGAGDDFAERGGTAGGRVGREALEDCPLPCRWGLE